MVPKIFKSGLGGCCISLIYFVLSSELDKKYDPRIANFIALLITTAMNFVIQHNIFLSSSIAPIQLYKFAFVVSIELMIIQLLFSFALSNKENLVNYIPVKFQKYYNTIIRAAIRSVIFLIIAYPTRKYWIFK